MSTHPLETIADLLPELDLNELHTLQMTVGVAIRILSQGNLSTDSAPSLVARDDEGT